MVLKLSRLSSCLNKIPRRYKSTLHEQSYRGALEAIPPTELSVCNNNLRVASQNLGTDTTTVGIFIKAGSRYEEESNNGAANLIQRLLFKGTAKRSVADLEAEVAKMGSPLAAYTSREQTAIYGTCMNQDVPKLIEILADIVQNANLSDADLSNVKKDVLREHNDIEGNLKDIVLDYLHGTAFLGTPLAQNVLGPRKNIEKLQSADLKSYVEANFKSSRMVLAAAGGVSHSEVSQLAEQHLGKLQSGFDDSTLSRCRYTGSDFRVRDDSIPLAHIAIAVEGPSYNSPDYLPVEIAKSVLGKYVPSMGKWEGSPSDFCHSYKAFNKTYSDTGLFGVYGVAGPMQGNDFTEAVIYNWHRLGRQITDAELYAAKNHLITKRLRKTDGSKGNCLAIGKSVLAFDRRIPLKELVESIENTSNDTIRQVIEKYTHNKCLVISAVGPVENMHEYVYYRNQMWKIF